MRKNVKFQTRLGKNSKVLNALNMSPAGCFFARKERQWASQIWCGHLEKGVENKKSNYVSTALVSEHPRVNSKFDYWMWKKDGIFFHSLLKVNVNEIGKKDIFIFEKKRNSI